MELNYNDIIDSHKNEIALVLAHGPSSSDIIPHLPKLRSKGVKVFSCNNWSRFTTEPIDYWILANSEYTVAKNYNTINNYKGTKLFYANSADVKSNPDVLSIDFLRYDERHVDGKPCSPQCTKQCHNRKDGVKSIHQVLQDYSGHNSMYISSGTVTVHMIAFAILMGFKDIYLCGMELDYKKGYAMGKGANPLNFSPWKQPTINSIEILSQTASCKGAYLYATNNQPLHGVLERKDICELLQ